MVFESSCSGKKKYNTSYFAPMFCIHHDKHSSTLYRCLKKKRSASKNKMGTNTKRNQQDLVARRFIIVCDLLYSSLPMRTLFPAYISH